MPSDKKPKDLNELITFIVGNRVTIQATRETMRILKKEFLELVEHEI